MSYLILILIENNNYKIETLQMAANALLKIKPVSLPEIDGIAAKIERLKKQNLILNSSESMGAQNN